MYPPIEPEVEDIDNEVQGLDPEVGGLLPDEMLSDEIDGGLPPDGDIPNPGETPIPNEEVEETIDEDDTLPEEIKTALKSIVDEFDRNEQPVRENMIRFWKKLDLFWKGIQDIYWDYSAKDYRRLNTDNDGQAGEIDHYYQDKIINIFRAHGESVISALSQDVPTTIFPPDDADNPDDQATSKGYTKAAELLQKCNDVEYLLMYAIQVLWCQGVVGAYNYNTTDFEFGSYMEPQFKEITDYEREYNCDTCGAPMQGEGEPCIDCEQGSGMLMNETPVKRTVYSHDAEMPKRRERIEFYGPLNFRIPHYVTAPKHSPYVMLDTECHIDYVRDLFPNLDISEEHDLGKYDRWARTSTDYQGDFTTGLVTLRRVWLRAWVYNRYKRDQKEIYTFLTTNFPEGLKVTLVNDKIAEIVKEDVDDHWTFTQSPLSTHIHAEPLGASLLPIQEMRNELVVLKLQTVEYGIPETFADPSVLDFDQYRKRENRPGEVYPAKAIPGMGLDAGFTTLKTAVFPKEANDFQQSLDQDGQFMSGAFPSVYGGAMPSASKTAAEYQMSRNQALQRLQNTWKILSRFWAKVMDKSVRSFILNMQKDEQFVKKQGSSYINMYIRQSEMTGRVGVAEPEIAQTFPMSWMQKKDMLVQMMQLNNEYINEALFHPENTGLLAQYLGFKDFHIPGDDDRSKQLREIQDMLLSEPIENVPPAMGQGMEQSGMPPQQGQELPPMEGGGNQPQGPPPMQSTVPVDPEMDNHKIEHETCLSWMKSEIGQEAKISNPAGFLNIRTHAAEHLKFVIMEQEQEAEAGQESAEGEPMPEGEQE